MLPANRMGANVCQTVKPSSLSWEVDVEHFHIFYLLFLRF